MNDKDKPGSLRSAGSAEGSRGLMPGASSEHDWECMLVINPSLRIAPAGFYYWHCKRCGRTRPYPDANPPRGDCKTLEAPATDPPASPNSGRTEQPCEHIRLNEDGICRTCGADRRGI